MLAVPAGNGEMPARLTAMCWLIDSSIGRADSLGTSGA
jgi:hypothetical protein